MSKVLKVGGVTPSGVASGLRLTENGTLPIYSPQKDFFIGSVVEPVPHGHVGARGIFGLKCRGRVPLKNRTPGVRRMRAVQATNRGVVVVGNDLIQAFDDSLNPLWVKETRFSSTAGVALHPDDGMFVATNTSSEQYITLMNPNGGVLAEWSASPASFMPPNGLPGMVIIDAHLYFLHSDVRIVKLDLALNEIASWPIPTGLDGILRGLYAFDDKLYFVVSTGSSLKPSVYVIDPVSMTAEKEWFSSSGHIEALLDGGDYLYGALWDGGLLRINRDAPDSSFFDAHAVLPYRGRLKGLTKQQNDLFVAVDTGGSVISFSLDGVIRWAINYRDFKGFPVDIVTAINDSIVAVTENELLVLSEDLQLKGYTLS